MRERDADRDRKRSRRRLAPLAAAAAALLLGPLTAPPCAAKGVAPGDPPSAASVGEDPAAVRLVLRHERDEGRIVVRIGGRVVLSAPIAALRDDAPGTIVKDLSVPGGRQEVVVEVRDALGRVLAQAGTEATMAAASPRTLDVTEHLGTGNGLSLAWRTP